MPRCSVTVERCSDYERDWLLSNCFPNFNRSHLSPCAACGYSILLTSAIQRSDPPVFQANSTRAGPMLPPPPSLSHTLKIISSCTPPQPGDVEDKEERDDFQQSESTGQAVGLMRSSVTAAATLAIHHAKHPIPLFYHTYRMCTITPLCTNVIINLKPHRLLLLLSLMVLSGLMVPHNVLVFGLFVFFF